jgi:O-succinylbenzoic acid--CoA ligase
MMVEPWILRAPPSVVAVETAVERVTYGELVERARGAVFAPGERVGLALPPGVDFVVAFWAIALAGAVVVPIDPRLGTRERAAIEARVDMLVDAPLENARKNAAIPSSAPRGTPTRGAPTRAAPPRTPALEDPLMVVHTSGTTGAPRPVELTYGNVLANALGCAVALGHRTDERWLCPLPLSHVGGLMVLLRSAIYGTTAVLDGPERDDVTIASMVPTQLARLIAAGTKPGPRLRVVMLGGAAADPRLLDAGWPVVTTYGMTQTCSAVAVDGRPLPNVHIEIADDAEILVAGPMVAGGGTHRTGDLGRIEDGRLVVTGRKSDTIISGGENVVPDEVESALLEHPAVAEAGVFGRVDPDWGEAVTAHVVLRGEASPEELRGWCAQRLAGFKVPKAIVAVDALPRNAAGKLLRREMA